jgi:nucleotide-binding universal stress UspA family protein
MIWVAIAIVVASVAIGAAVLAVRWHSPELVAKRITPAARRVLFPFLGSRVSESALDATLRLARAENATLMPVLIALVPMRLPLDVPIARQWERAMPLLEAIEQRAARVGVPVDSRIETGRTPRHALQSLIEHEDFDRIVVPAGTKRSTGFSAADVAWLLDNAPGEIAVLRPSFEHDTTTSAKGRRASRSWAPIADGRKK